jgi:hypothetical protein
VRRVVRSFEAVGAEQRIVQRVAAAWRIPVSRFSVAATVVTLGALAVSATAVIGAFTVIDQRAAQVLKDGPRAVPAVQKRTSSADASRASQQARSPAGSKNRPAAPANAQTVGSAAATSGAAPPQTMTGETGDKKPRSEARQRARHEKRAARRHSQEPPSQQPTLQQQPPQQPPALQPAAQDRNRSAAFFPFR